MKSRVLACIVSAMRMDRNGADGEAADARLLSFAVVVVADAALADALLLIVDALVVEARADFVPSRLRKCSCPRSRLSPTRFAATGKDVNAAIVQHVAAELKTKNWR